MTLGQEIYQMVYDMIDTTVYSSAAGPDVDNRAKIIYQDPGLITAIDEALKQMQTSGELGTTTKESVNGGGGEFENALAEMLNNDWMGAAELSMTDEEYASWMASDTKKAPNLGGLGVTEEKGVSLVKSGLGAAFDPASLGMNLISKLPHAALVLLAISLAPMIVDQLKSPGSMLDVRWKRLMQEEYNALMSRQEQWNAQIGVRQVYVASHDQFLIGNGAALSESNLRRVRESDQRIADRLEFTDHAREFFK